MAKFHNKVTFLEKEVEKDGLHVMALPIGILEASDLFPFRHQPEFTPGYYGRL